MNPSGFRIWTPTSITTSVTAAPTTVSIRPVMRDPITLNTTTSQAVRGGLTVSMAFTSSLPAVGTVTASPVVFNGGELFALSGFQPVSAGSCTLFLGVPAGFDPPSNNVQIPATVNP